MIGTSLVARTRSAQDPGAIGDTLRATDGALTPLFPPIGHRPPEIALADALLIELRDGGRPDLQRLAQAWVAWHVQDGFERDSTLTAVLEHLREYDAPVESLPNANSLALAAALPAALMAASPRAMLSGAFHVARMLDPRPETALAAAAMVLAASILLDGRRDFVGDVTAMLRANDAPAELLSRFNNIPREPTRVPVLPTTAPLDPVAVAVWVLWNVHHAPGGMAALNPDSAGTGEPLRQLALRGGIPTVIGCLLGALHGARDGIRRWPAAWLDRDAPAVAMRRQWAERLIPR